MGLRKIGDVITKNSSMAQFSCTSLKEQGAEERGCTKDFSHVLKLLYFLGNKAMLI